MGVQNSVGDSFNDVFTDTFMPVAVRCPIFVNGRTQIAVILPDHSCGLAHYLMGRRFVVRFRSRLAGADGGSENLIFANGSIRRWWH